MRCEAASIIASHLVYCNLPVASGVDFRAMDRWLECGDHIDIIPGRHLFVFLCNRNHIDMVPRSILHVAHLMVLK
jgi:hypothetical protein